MPGFRFMLSLLVASVAFIATAVDAQPSDSAALDDVAYQDCLSLVRRNPDAGFAPAQVWQATGGGLPAATFAALALVELKHYGDAAARLDDLLPLAEKQVLAFSVLLPAKDANTWQLDASAK